MLWTSFNNQDESSNGNDHAFALTLKVIPFIILCIIYYKMQIFDDEFYVQLELQRLFLYLMLQIICVYCATILQIFTQENILWNAVIGPYITYNTTIFWHFISTLICTWCVNNKVSKIIDKKNIQ